MIDTWQRIRANVLRGESRYSSTLGQQRDKVSDSFANKTNLQLQPTN